jgi:hypothetical protein
MEVAVELDPQVHDINRVSYSDSIGNNPYPMYSIEWFIRKHQIEIKDLAKENKELLAKAIANEVTIQKLRKWNRELLGRKAKGEPINLNLTLEEVINNGTH